MNGQDLNATSKSRQLFNVTDCRERAQRFAQDTANALDRTAANAITDGWEPFAMFQFATVFLKMARIVVKEKVIAENRTLANVLKAGMVQLAKFRQLHRFVTT